MISGLHRAIRIVCTQIAEDGRLIREALSSRRETLFSRQTRHFNLVAKNSDISCELDEYSEKLLFVLDAILNKGAHYSTIELTVVCLGMDQILASGFMPDVLRIPGEPLYRWTDLNIVNEIMTEAREAIHDILQALATIRWI